MFVIVDANVSIVDDDYVTEEGNDIMVEDIYIFTWAVNMICSVEYPFNVTIITPFSSKLMF